ncbi:unannotated protein [freshwater metagenome]|uniref:Unannotated protein n=1 Tax=freshwater metagenome TaxID=449393 RepID=A0A6J7MGE6_9ZZZZ
MPIVIGLEHGQSDLLVLCTSKELPTELWKRREAHRAEYAVGIHILYSVVNVVTASSHLGECGGLDSVLFVRLAGHGIQTNIGQLLALIEPHIASILGNNYARRSVFVLRRQMVLEHVWRLDNMVIYRDQD